MYTHTECLPAHSTVAYNTYLPESPPAAIYSRRIGTYGCPAAVARTEFGTSTRQPVALSPGRVGPFVLPTARKNEARPASRMCAWRCKKRSRSEQHRYTLSSGRPSGQRTFTAPVLLLPPCGQCARRTAAPAAQPAAGRAQLFKHGCLNEHAAPIRTVVRSRAPPCTSWSPLVLTSSGRRCCCRRRRRRHPAPPGPRPGSRPRRALRPWSCRRRSPCWNGRRWWPAWQIRPAPAAVSHLCR